MPVDRDLIIIEQNRETHDLLGRLLKGQTRIMATIQDLDVEIKGELSTAVQTIIDLVETLETKIDAGDDTSNELASLKSLAQRLQVAVPTPPAAAPVTAPNAADATADDSDDAGVTEDQTQLDPTPNDKQDANTPPASTDPTVPSASTDEDAAAVVGKPTTPTDADSPNAAPPPLPTS